MTTGQPASVKVDDFLDGLKLNRFHITVLIMCTVLTAIDGYELYVVGWILPLLAEDFGVPRENLAWVLSVQQVGMLVGAFIVPPLADRWGRPRTLLACFAGMMLSALAILHTHSIVPFAVFRFIAGFCGTAMVPILVTLASEAAPTHLRSTFSTITVSGTMIGALLGAIMQAFILEPYGWHGAFWIAVAMPAIMLPLIWLYLPESLRSMVARNPADPLIPAVVARMQPAGAEPVTVVSGGDDYVRRKGLGNLSDILGAGQLVKTMLMWAIAISSFVFITAGVWKSTIFKDVIGLNWQEVGAVNATNTAAGFLGMLFIGWFIDRLGFKLVMPLTFLIAALGASMVGVLAPGFGMFIAVAIMAIFQHGGQASVAALAAALYPPKVRATGIGWAYGAGRIASIGAPMYGYFVTSGMGAEILFILLAVPLASAAIFSYLLLGLKDAPKISRASLKHG
ncbi:MAG: MFS transporter [Blastomonas sp.]